MDKGTVHIYCGKGKGKTTSAIGQAIKAACEGRNVVIIEFLKAKEEDELGFLKRLEPEIKVFRFEKFQECFEDLPEEKKEEEILNMKNALNFARKVLVTEECDVLILDEVLGLIPHGIAGEAELRTILEARSGSTDLYMTGVYGAREIWDAVDEVTELVAHKSLPAPDKTAVDKENQ